MPAFSLTVNGRTTEIETEAKTPLLYILRNHLSLKGTRFGCGTGHCGACTVIINGKAMQSCDTPMWSVDGAEIRTIEGLGRDGEPDPLQQAFVDEQAIQCGYCITGIIMSVRALFDRDPSASNEVICAELAERHLCRCGTHVRILAAIRRARDKGAEG